jgi:hypothetical protein
VERGESEREKNILTSGAVLFWVPEGRGKTKKVQVPGKWLVNGEAVSRNRFNHGGNGVRHRVTRRKKLCETPYLTP